MKTAIGYKLFRVSKNCPGEIISSVCKCKYEYSNWRMD